MYIRYLNREHQNKNTELYLTAYSLETMRNQGEIDMLQNLSHDVINITYKYNIMNMISGLSQCLVSG